MASLNAKELAEAAALANLESLRAALDVEVALRGELRVARAHSASSAMTVETKVREAEKRSNAAFTAWRKSQEAVP
jgi:hypothetical protein